MKRQKNRRNIMNGMCLNMKYKQMVLILTVLSVLLIGLSFYATIAAAADMAGEGFDIKLEISLKGASADDIGKLLKAFEGMGIVDLGGDEDSVPDTPFGLLNPINGTKEPVPDATPHLIWIPNEKPSRTKGE
jgi:hypothetical protein